MRTRDWLYILEGQLACKMVAARHYCTVLYLQNQVELHFERVLDVYQLVYAYGLIH